MKSSGTKRKHHYHHGVDLTGRATENEDCVGVSCDFHDITVLSTPSFGSCQVFVVASTSEFTCIKISGRHHFGHDGPMTILECTQLSNFPQSCTENVCVFQEKKSNTWHLAVAQHLFALNDEPIVRLLEWIDDVACYGTPSFSCCHQKTWNDINDGFKSSSYLLSDKELLFVNQVCGVSILLDPICPTTSNASDGSIQSSC